MTNCKRHRLNFRSNWREDCMFFVFWLVFFVIGFVFGVLLLLFGIIAISLTERKSNEKKHPASSPKFNKTVPLKWLNTLMWMIFPSFLNSRLLKREIKKIFRSIPNDVGAIKSLKLKEFHLKNENPPTIDGMSLISGSGRDHLEFQFHYDPGLTITAAAELILPYIRGVSVTLNFSLHSFLGNLKLFVPKNEGRAEIQIIDNTKIDCDVKAELAGLIRVQTDDMQAIWSSLLDWVHSYLRAKVITVPLEECLEGDKSKKKEEKKGNPLVKVRMYSDYHEYVF